MSMFYFKIDYGDTPSVDDGVSPYSGARPFWNNNSLWLTGGPSQTSTAVGDATQVKARVTNTAAEYDGNVYVQAWIFQPFVGQVTPDDGIHVDGVSTDPLIAFTGSLFDVPNGSGASTEDAGQPKTHVALAGTSGGTGSWTPQADELSTYGGHLCICANVYSNSDGAALSTDTPFATTTYTDGDGNQQPRDAHHGQRNIALLSSGQPLQWLPFTIMPPLVTGRATLLDIHPLAGGLAVGAGERWLLRSRSNVSLEDGRLVIPGTRGKDATPLADSRKAVRGTLEVPGFGGMDLHEAAAATEAATLRATEGKNRVPYLKSEGGARIRLEAVKEPLAATLSLQRDDAKGSLQAFEIVQRTEDGQILGGLTVLSLVSGVER
jgi:hypothetical protein